MKLPGSDKVGIRAGLTVGNPCYWSMLSLVFVKTILKPTNYLRKFWVGFFLLLTWYRSNSESSYLVLVSKVLLSYLLLQTFRFSGLGSTSSTPCQVAMSQSVCSFVWVLHPQWLEQKVPDCAGIQVCWLMWFFNHVRITLESQYMKLTFNPRSFFVDPLLLMFKH